MAIAGGGHCRSVNLLPRGLDPKRSYAVTFDNRGTTEVLQGVALVSEGLVIRPPANLRSELLLFEAK